MSSDAVERAMAEARTITLTITAGDLESLYLYGPLTNGHALLTEAWEAAENTTRGAQHDHEE